MQADCTNCGDEYQGDDVRECEECALNFCYRHSDKCSDCKKYFCDDHRFTNATMPNEWRCKECLEKHNIV